MRVVVTGGRTYARQVFVRAWSGLPTKPEELVAAEVAHVYRTLDALHQHEPIARLAHGGARGADACAGRWAAERGVECAVYPAAWASEGPSAGHLRNRRMLREERPDAVVAFPGGAGTLDMMNQAARAGITVLQTTMREN